MTSQARIDANRQNAQKSTGPRTKEGKQRSRQNALRHGLRAEVLDLPEERDVIAARVLGWAVAFRPATEPERWIVARAAAASVKLDRCTELEAARIDKRVRKVRTRFLDGRQAEAEQLAGMVGAVDEVLGRLRATAIGCEALLGLLDELEEALGAGTWGPEQSLRLGNLLGYPNGTSRPHPELLALIEDAGRIARGDAATVERLRERIAGARAELEGRCEELWEEVDGPELREALALARFDGSKRAATMQRYESAHSAELHRCLRQLKARVGAPNEANAPNQILNSGGDTTSKPGLACVTSGTEAASSIHDPALQDPSPTPPCPAAPNEPNAPPQTLEIQELMPGDAPPPAASSIHDPANPHPSPTHPASAPNEPRPTPPPAAPNEPNAAAQLQARRPPASQVRTERLEMNPAVSDRWPVVRGTTITVEDIATSLRPPHDRSPAQVVAAYDGRITLEDVRAARACWAEMTYTPSA